MRKTSLPVGVEPMPLTWGSKKRAATCDITTKAERPWKSGMVMRPVKPGIFERSHSMGKVSGEFPNTLKS
jgi:hypothetical protein